MGLIPSVTIIDEATSDVLMTTVGWHSYPEMGTVLFLSSEGGVQVAWKVEKVELYLDEIIHQNRVGPTNRTSTSVSCKILVSLVP